MFFRILKLPNSFALQLYHRLRLCPVPGCRALLASGSRVHILLRLITLYWAIELFLHQLVSTFARTHDLVAGYISLRLALLAHIIDLNRILGIYEFIGIQLFFGRRWPS